MKNDNTCIINANPLPSKKKAFPESKDYVKNTSLHALDFEPVFFLRVIYNFLSHFFHLKQIEMSNVVFFVI